MDSKDCFSTSASSLSDQEASPQAAFQPSFSKRNAGRKKFRVTRHPVYRGVRERNVGKWVCEVREPHKKSRIWLGTYPTPEMAARAHDIAALAFRGKSAMLNFPDSAWVLPAASSSRPDDIRHAAVKAAEMYRPTHGAARPTMEMEAAENVVFMDEEALFNMPGIWLEMAAGLLITPPGMKGKYDWDVAEWVSEQMLYW
ncbi:Dehydration-responsive element-binding protein 1D [Platanthera zijinensis]|uniref:Dehydration-responsive element-binding protein 1D n=1 Tax=Platanthera zijinensis TaxID=2320716 RepID=A0AAP0B942_9ASPA